MDLIVKNLNIQKDEYLKQASMCFFDFFNGFLVKFEPIESIIDQSHEFIRRSDQRIQQLTQEIAETNKLYTRPQEEPYKPIFQPLDKDMIDLGKSIIDEIMTLVFLDVNKYQSQIMEMKDRAGFLLQKSEKQQMKIGYFASKLAIKE